MASAMILAAGFGTRLQPLTLELPKPLVWVGDRPAIAHIAERLVAAGIEDLVINTHHRREAFSEEALSLIPGRLSILTEPSILGTGGGVANAASLLGDGDVVVWNGDILAPLDARELLRAHRGDATLVIAPRPRGEGTVGVGADGEVVRLRGERFGEEVTAGDFLGIYVLGAELRRTLPMPGCLIGEGLLPWLRRGRKARVFRADLTWDDIGSLRSYLRANARWLAGRAGGFFMGEGASIAPTVEVMGSVIGRGAVVRGQGKIEGCVIWPGATAEAPLSRAVVTPGGKIVIDE
ncbi:MAG: NDP-sugar synthase [Polyangiaceae bacterium]